MEKSRELIEKYIAHNPVGVNPLDSKAEIQVLTGRYDETIENCEHILELQPGYENTLLNLARTYMARGQYSRAMDLLQTGRNGRQLDKRSFFVAQCFFKHFQGANDPFFIRCNILQKLIHFLGDAYSEAYQTHTTKIRTYLFKCRHC